MKNKNSNQNKVIPIIIKRIVGNKHEHSHNGAWKVAYADFVTAMMAFFLLLWLLNSVPSSKLKGIAQYFEPTIGILGKSGSNSDNNSRKSNEKDEVDSEGVNVKGIVYGVPQTGSTTNSDMNDNAEEKEQVENERFSIFEKELNKAIQNDSTLKQFKDSISLTQTAEGLVIKITDADKKPMFQAGSDNLEAYAKVILKKVAELIKYSPNFIAIGGYTDKSNDSSSEDYSNWELSADRANATRRFLVSSGIAPEKIARITGFADTDPLVPSNPYDYKNRRISIMLLRNSAMPSYKVSITPDLMLNTKN